MGLALVVGVATKIVVEKEDDYKYCTKEEILRDLKDELNFNLYDVEEDERRVIFYIKEDVLVKNIYNLLLSETKSEKMRNDERSKLNQILEKIKSNDSTEKIENTIRTEGVPFFHIMSGNYFETISYISSRGLTVYTEMIVYNMAYKVFLECYNGMLKYLRDKIRNAIDNPLKDDVFLMITTG